MTDDRLQLKTTNRSNSL